MKIVRAALAVCTLLLPPAGPATADDPVLTVQKVIAAQIEAFLADDAAAAYAFASPAIRQKFPDETSFFDMVKRGYAPVYRPGNFAFGRSRVADDTVLQEVLISGSDGKDWTAVYQVVRQPDGSYRINGVHMMRSVAGPDI
ncbi:DUF4864 domain-containing protein [Rhizobium sp. GN54]|uniref:DUF4864 domain-containing protein n=1 Tax=Rhizobium sp. GN54 TaxID=2898150 RepID=UPI001E484F87|nr:DUF4864 domain-containing protein [Rhizobium sp. GN54]MCD2184429.1 DUF4864 domain-containing protein [Rhizobium sp. GN54]